MKFCFVDYFANIFILLEFWSGLLLITCNTVQPAGGGGGGHVMPQDEKTKLVNGQMSFILQPTANIYKDRMESKVMNGNLPRDWASIKT